MPKTELQKFAEQYQENRIKRAQEKIKHRPRSNHWASTIKGCVRRGVYEWTHWDQKKLHDPVLQLRFDEGNNQEDIVRREFELEAPSLGFEVVERGVSLSKDFTKAHRIVGKLDFKLKSKKTRKLYAAEVKSMQSFIFDKIEKMTDEELIKHLKEDPFLVGYYNQLQNYLYGSELMREGLFIFKSLDGRTRLLVVPFDDKAVEEIIKNVEVMNKHLDEKTLPDRIDFDPDVCGKCPFAHICVPDVINRTKLEFKDDKVLEQMLDERGRLWDDHKRAKALDDMIKKKLREHPLAVVGQWTITGKWQNRTNYNLPDNVKKQYAEVSKSWKMKIELTENSK